MDIADVSGKTALVLAMRSKKMGVVKLLLENRVNTDFVSRGDPHINK